MGAKWDSKVGERKLPFFEVGGWEDRLLLNRANSPKENEWFLWINVQTRSLAKESKLLENTKNWWWVPSREKKNIICKCKVSDTLNCTLGMISETLLLRSKSEHPWKLFHTTYKNIRGQGVFLSNSTMTRKEPMNITIYSYWVGSRGNALHYKQDKMSRETKVAKKAF